AHLLTGPVEVVEEGHHVFGGALRPLGIDDGVDGLGITENALWILEVLKVVRSPHPVGSPTGDDYRLITLDGAVQGGGHSRVRTIEQDHVTQLVGFHRTIAGGHEARAWIDADDLTTEHIGVLVDFSDAIDLDVGRNGPAD